MRTAVQSLASLAVCLFLAAPLTAQNFNGSWSGTYTYSQPCGNGTVTSSGSSQAYFAQNGSNVVGDVLLSNFDAEDSSCQSIGKYPFVFGISGAIASGTLSASPDGFHASDLVSTGVKIVVTGDAMTITFTDTSTNTQNGSANLTRTSSATPANSTGPSTGTYDASDKWDVCTNTITYSGTFKGTSIRAGSLFSVDGPVTGSKYPSGLNGDGSCIVSDGPFTTWNLGGQINGNSVTGSLFFVGVYAFSGTLNGTTLTGTATGFNPGGLQASLTLTVNLQAATGGGGASVVVSQLPVGILQPSGAGGATDTFSLTNNGDASTQVTLSPSQSFYTLSQTSFTLQPNQTQSITITGKPQPAGTFTDNLAIGGTGVPANTSVKVQLVSAAPPTGTVNATPSVTRIDSVSTGTTNSGSIGFTNPGTDKLTGLVTADVPWLTASNAVVTINPNQSATINFTIDRTKRPDADALVGSVGCNLQLTFLTGAGSAAKPIVFGSGNSRTVAVPVQDTVKPSTAAGAPNALQSGELALFAAGMRAATNSVSDLVLANKRTASVSDLKLYGAASATAFGKVLNVPTLTGDVASAFAAVAKNVFDISGTPASVLLRSAQAASVAVNPMQVSTPSSRASFVSAVPVLRSDAGAAANEKLFLPGVEKTSSLSTSLDLQEMTGTATTVQSEFLRADGSVLSTRNDSLGPFGFLEVADAVPSGATAVRVTNKTASTKVAAFARVSDASTGDSWTVIDPKAEFAGAAGDLIVPVFATTGSTARFVDIMNPGSSTASVKVSTFSGSTRRRAARARSVGSIASLQPQTESDKTISVNSQATSRVTIDPISTGFLRLNSVSAVVASGRLVVSGTSGSFGSSLPAVPVSAALAISQNRRFAGISDAAPATITAQTPGTYRPSVMLIETAGQSAKVRVTLNYTLPGGTRATGSSTAQKEFTIGASQSLVVTDLAATLIGASRANIGDLRNMQLDIDVIDGGGRVIPVVAMVDNSTGDLMVRAE